MRAGFMSGLAAVVLILGTRAEAADAGAEAAALSSYVWRGQVLNDEPVAQPGMNVTSGGWGIYAWGNFNLTDSVREDPDFSEIDLTVSYGGRLGALGYGVGMIEYLFPNTPYPGTRELYANLSLPDALVVPSLSVYRDIDEVDGFYASFCASHSMAVAGKAALALCASIGAADADYNDFYFGVDEAAVNDASLSATLSIALTDAITLAPGVQYVWLPDSDIRSAARELYEDSGAFVGFLKLTYLPGL